MKKILVPTDFSEVSIHAAALATEIAQDSRAKLVLLHSAYFNYFNEFSYGVPFNAQPFIDELEEAMEEKIQEFKRKLGPNVEIQTIISSLSLMEAIQDVERSEKIDLIVVGTQGASGLQERFVGSNTERIVRKTKCPVIAVPSRTTIASIKKILVPIDILEIQDELMKKLSSLQKFLSASMEFVWVRTPHNVENEAVVRQEFEALMRTYGFTDCELCIISSLVPTEGILAYAEESRANMIAMATHARRGISHLWSGSITEDTINHISIPVWTYKLDKDAENIDLLVLSAKNKEIAQSE